ncbi:hypothetical protein BwSH20_74930 [Bradyrhizobium ottawaense]|uniref:Uncharacterized protein n=2 Tax=Bradyrhizobium diazoefficiens TaxID=1355477 RepID=A0A837CQB1_9BRAD|nr:hypothetical protein BJS_09053 [Bradyrhizobium japonicum SEMIA 5079]KGJ71509.1 hypothetical protein BJA5080_08020 [Bradyrhizobium diazoefficiens SEMIA 5080]BAR55698.1 hypothetical protein NK6_2517 [Bradyrhizobium diazoefficiens]GEC50471.1 hypothetical protein BJA01nite_81130 [Bradyrhizobium japonicum]GMO10667.1 hypothetical protein BwSH20_74930 [Bradyrhizobium ottawaense]
MAPRHLIPATDAIERPREEFERRIKIKTVCHQRPPRQCRPGLLTPGQINMRKVDGWRPLTTNPSIGNLGRA